MEKIDTIKIYALKQPNTLEIRYIGMTSKSLKQRLRKHLDNAIYTKHNLHLCNWILKHKIPVIELIEECTKENWQEKEKYWITFYKDNNLLNSTEGGEGSFGFKHSEKTIDKLREIKIGKKSSEESRIKISKSLKGRVFSDEHKSRIGNANRGKIYTKYKLKVTDTVNSFEHICNTIVECSSLTGCSQTHLRRLIDSGKKYNRQYIIVKI